MINSLPDTAPDDSSIGALQPTDADLLQTFDSLGGTLAGGEFGSFLRSIGGDAEGLMRSADLTPEQLLQALNDRFAGVGDPDNTTVFQPHHSDRWWTRDKTYWMASASPLKAADVPLAQAMDLLCARQRRLRDRLIDDLIRGDRTFVYRNARQDLTAAQIAALFAAVRAYGPSGLLYVRYADPRHPPGHVIQAKPGLLIGRMEHFATSPDGAPLGPPHQAWQRLCHAAWHVLHPQAPAPDGRPLLEPPPLRVDAHLATARAAAHPARASAADDVADEAVESEATPPRLHTPVWVRTGTRPHRIVTVGNCQVASMTGLFRKFAAGRSGDRIDCIVSYRDLPDDAMDLIRQADVIIEQVTDVAPRTDLRELAPTTPRLYIPSVSAAFLWPFAGQAHPQNDAPPFMTIGPYGGEAGDSVLNRAIAAGTDPEAAVDAYLALDASKQINLDRLYELVMDRQRSRDAAAGYRIADLIETHFRSEQIFQTPFHPGLRVSLALAEQFFRHLGARQDDIDRMRAGTRSPPFPRDELPIHPSVAAHFGLTWAPPDRRYRYMSEGSFTARDYALRYMRFEWNPDLEEGLALLRTGDPDAAEARLLAALDRAPDTAAALGALARIHAVRPETRDKAYTEIRQAVMLEPGTAAYLGILGNLLRTDGRLAEAEPWLRAAQAAAPGDAYFCQVLAGLLSQRGQDAEACALMQEAISLDPFAAPLRGHAADTLAAAGRLQEAADALAEAARLDPENLTWLQKQAGLLVRLDRLDEAIATLQAALSRAPRNIHLRVQISQIHGRAGRLTEAMSEAYAAAIAEPSSAAAFGQLGALLREASTFVPAERALLKAIELAPDHAHFRHELSVVYANLGRQADAVRLAEEAVARETSNAQRLVHLAALRGNAGDTAGAVDALARASAIDSGNAAIRVALSRALMQAGRGPEALRDFTAFAAARADDPAVSAHLAWLAEQCGAADAQGTPGGRHGRAAVSGQGSGETPSGPQAAGRRGRRRQRAAATGGAQTAT